MKNEPINPRPLKNPPKKTNVNAHENIEADIMNFPEWDIYAIRAELDRLDEKILEGKSVKLKKPAKQSKDTEKHAVRQEGKKAPGGECNTETGSGSFSQSLSGKILVNILYAILTVCIPAATFISGCSDRVVGPEKLSTLHLNLVIPTHSTGTLSPEFEPLSRAIDYTAVNRIRVRVQATDIQERVWTFPVTPAKARLAVPAGLKRKIWVGAYNVYQTSLGENWELWYEGSTTLDLVPGSEVNAEIVLERTR